MKQYNFDEIIDRRGTGAVKTDLLKERFGNADLFPMWVADMDFRTPDFILESVKDRCNQGILGYSITPPSFYPAVRQWLHTIHQWDVCEEWLEYIPGVVKGLAFCTMCFTRPGDKIIIQSPVYTPFRTVPENLGRTIVNNPLREVDGFYQMDLEHLESVMDENCKMLILCNPHNPVGITWDKETLQNLAKICKRHNVLVISDEIHADMALFGHRHVPYASISDTAAENSITLMAPSKTFNMAGVVCSYCIIPDISLREKFFSFLQSCELNQMHTFAGVSCVAAYSKGEEWLHEMLAYVEGNILYAENYIRENIPGIRTIRPQASFLIWLDCRDLYLTQEKLVALFIDKAGLALNDGSTFGPGGEGFMRMNIGCSRKILEIALARLKEALL